MFINKGWKSRCCWQAMESCGKFLPGRQIMRRWVKKQKQIKYCRLYCKSTVHGQYSDTLITIIQKNINKNQILQFCTNSINNLDFKNCTSAVQIKKVRLVAKWYSYRNKTNKLLFLFMYILKTCFYVMYYINFFCLYLTIHKQLLYANLHTKNYV